MNSRETVGKFCGAFLRTMDPDRAAAECGVKDGYAWLRRQNVGCRLDQMRQGAAEQLRREDVLRRLAQLAFGRANDAVALALRFREMEPDALDRLDLSGVTEFRVSDKGGVEVKLADRVRALEALGTLLDQQGNGGIEALYQALENAAEVLEGDECHGDT